MPISDSILLMMAIVTAGCTATTRNPPGFENQAALAEQQRSSVDELLQKTPPGASVRVIVQLRIPDGPDATREARIKAAQQALLDELSGAPHKLLRTYSATPAVALEASREALTVLRESAHVARVDEDALARPFK